MSERTVLVVDDDRDLLGLLEAVLESAGFRVVTATDAVGAWDRFSKIHPSAILLDWMLPGVDGGLLCGHLRHAGGDGLAILMMSCDDRLARRARDFGADGYILKPFDIGVLVDRLTSLINRCCARDVFSQLNYAQ